MQANEFVRREFPLVLQPMMPTALPTSFRSASGAAYATALRLALAKTMETLNADFSARQELAGCTMTVCVVSGGLITVANVGDSDAVLDVFSETFPMSVPHRVNDNDDERKRVEAMGAPLSPPHACRVGSAAAMSAQARQRRRAQARRGDGCAPRCALPGTVCTTPVLGHTLPSRRAAALVAPLSVHMDGPACDGSAR